MHPNNTNFVKENWLSDPSVYPLIAIMSGGAIFVICMGTNALFGYKDVQIDPRKRNSMLQTWGKEERIPVVYRVHKVTTREDNPEGLGINHKEWQKQHDEAAVKAAEKQQEHQHR